MPNNMPSATGSDPIAVSSGTIDPSCDSATETFTISAGSSGPAIVEVNGPAASTQTFDMVASGWGSTLIIDNPATFQAAIDITAPQNPTGTTIDLKGLKAASYTYMNGTLSIYGSNGAVIDTLTISNPQNATIGVAQSGSDLNVGFSLHGPVIVTGTTVQPQSAASGNPTPGSGGGTGTGPGTGGGTGGGTGPTTGSTPAGSPNTSPGTPAVSGTGSSPNTTPVTPAGGSGTGTTPTTTPVTPVGSSPGTGTGTTPTTSPITPVGSPPSTGTTTTPTVAPITSASTGSPSGSFEITDTSKHTAAIASGTAYTGPVKGVNSEFVAITHDNLNIAALTPNAFLQADGGNDALIAMSGTNVLDVGGGGNFMTGGSGSNNFFVDLRNLTANAWTTINNMHAGDSLTVWGVTPQDLIYPTNGAGAPGSQGLTLSFAGLGHSANITLIGYNSQAFLNEKLTLGYGATQNQPGLPSVKYLAIHAT